jgi:hypothetical protein
LVHSFLRCKASNKEWCMSKLWRQKDARPYCALY